MKITWIFLSIIAALLPISLSSQEPAIEQPASQSTETAATAETSTPAPTAASAPTSVPPTATPPTAPTPAKEATPAKAGKRSAAQSAPKQAAPTAAAHTKSARPGQKLDTLSTTTGKAPEKGTKKTPEKPPVERLLLHVKVYLPNQETEKGNEEMIRGLSARDRDFPINHQMLGEEKNKKAYLSYPGPDGKMYYLFVGYDPKLIDDQDMSEALNAATMLYNTYK